MPTSTTRSSSPAASSSACAELSDLLAASQSATIYVDAELNDKDAASLLECDPPLHAEHDVVRNQWAIRKATAEEVADAKAATATSSAASSSA
ncbi:MAG TPA: hypothetical protein VE963_00325 [Reyranella sp.]|nr:hypothetical protein [Reyranella sp.]